MKIENSQSKCKIDFVSNTFSQEILRMLLNVFELFWPQKTQGLGICNSFFQATKLTSIEEEQHEQVKKWKCRHCACPIADNPWNGFFWNRRCMSFNWKKIQPWPNVTKRHKTLTLSISRFIWGTIHIIRATFFKSIWPSCEFCFPKSSIFWT